MKKYITAIMVAAALMASLNVAATSFDTGNVLYENFESETSNFLAQTSNGVAEVVTDTEAQNSTILLKPHDGEASFYKSFRKTKGNFTLGFKMLATEGEPLLKIDILSSSSKPITAITIHSTGTEENENSSVNKATEWKHIRMFFDLKEKQLRVKDDKNEIGIFSVPQEILNGVSGVKFTVSSEKASAMQLDDIYCYIGIDERSDYETLTDSQRILYRLKSGVAVFENRGKAIINGKQYFSDASFAPLGESGQLIALRIAAEAFGAEVLWNGAENAIVVKYDDKEISFFNGKSTAKLNGKNVEMNDKCMIIGSSTYVPISSLSELLGKNLYQDELGLRIMSDTAIFLNSEEDTRLLKLLTGTLSGVEYKERIDGGYLLIPDSLADTAMLQIPIKNIWADYNQEGNTPENAIDGSFDTRWSSDVDGSELTLDLGEEKKVSSVYISWMNATERKTYFEILGSKDGVNYESVIPRTESTGTTDTHEVYLFDGNYRYIRYKGYGNSVNLWNSVTEIGVMEKAVQHE